MLPESSRMNMTFGNALIFVASAKGSVASSVVAPWAFAPMMEMASNSPLRNILVVKAVMASPRFIW